MHCTRSCVLGAAGGEFLSASIGAWSETSTGPWALMPASVLQGPVTCDRCLTSANCWCFLYGLGGETNLTAQQDVNSRPDRRR